MAVWKPDWSNRHPSYRTAGCGADLDRLVDLLEKDHDNADLRRQLGEEMEGAGVNRHRGWVAEYRIVSAKTVPGREAEAAAWLTSRGLRVPKGKDASKVLAREIQRHVVADGNDWPPHDVFEWDVLWTARPT